MQELLFVFGLKWGVVGAALAPAIGQYVGLAVMVGLLIKEKALFAEDLSSIPTLKEVTPLLQVSNHSCSVACRNFSLFQWFLLNTRRFQRPGAYTWFEMAPKSCTSIRTSGFPRS